MLFLFWKQTKATSGDRVHCVDSQARVLWQTLKLFVIVGSILCTSKALSALIMCSILRSIAEHLQAGMLALKHLELTCSEACCRTWATLVRIVAIARCCSCLNLLAYELASAYCGLLLTYLH